ncbi:MAG: aconitate hydratase [Acidimicrobiales bacterium]
MSAVQPRTPEALVSQLYQRLPERVEAARRLLGRPVTLAEKILFSHLVHGPEGPAAPERGRTYVELCPDRVAMQDATAQMALLQFMTAGLEQVAVPTTVHCDHLIQARLGAAADLDEAAEANGEVYKFLRSASARYGIGFWEPGSGIIHQVVLEQYACPGGLMIGTDSHTPNAGGLSMVAVGVGGAEAVDVLVGGSFGLRWPGMIGVHLTGALSGWTAPKDVILKVAELLTVKGGTGAVIEYFGPGAETISATGKATICNMGAEIGATCSVFGYDCHADAYLRATGRQELADLARTVEPHLRADDEVVLDPARCFDRVIEIDLSTLEPHIVGPHTPDRSRRVSRMGSEAKLNGWPLHLSACLVGSCTNSSYEDITRAANVARQASARGLRAKVPLLVTPGSEQVRATIERDGLLGDLERIGATVLANACGPCIGQWKRSDVHEGETNSILTSYNRNFPKRNDGNAQTLAFIASPETVVAYSLAGTLDYDPLADQVEGALLEAPTGEALPSAGFESGGAGYVPPPADGSTVEVVVRPDSQRLQLLSPFPAWDGSDFVDLPVLVKAQGKCTTDHISAAGRWLAYRGHLDNICGNLFAGVSNAFTGEVGRGRCPVHGVTEPYPDAARHCAQAGRRWVVVADENYGEGSSREHAAMEPRHLGAVAVLARSFARIAEVNLKKQGVLALTFVDPAIWEKVGVDDLVSVLGLAELAPGRPVRCRLSRRSGPGLDFECTHTMSAEHIEWWRAGSALNLIRVRLAP